MYDGSVGFTRCKAEAIPRLSAGGFDISMLEAAACLMMRKGRKGTRCICRTLGICSGVQSTKQQCMR